MDNQDRKITFEGSNSNDRNDNRWKINLFPKAQKSAEKECFSGLGRQERKMFLLFFFAKTGGFCDKSRCSGKRAVITAFSTRHPRPAASTSIGSTAIWSPTSLLVFNRRASTVRRRS